MLAAVALRGHRVLDAATVTPVVVMPAVVMPVVVMPVVVTPVVVSSPRMRR